MGIKIEKITGKAVHVPGNDVDTDRIIPARFLKCVTFEGLGEHAFRDERYEESGATKSHPLNDSRYSEASIMLVGRNFGCGSSREHAPQALARAGGTEGNKGCEAAEAAIEMAGLADRLAKSPGSSD